MSQETLTFTLNITPGTTPPTPFTVKDSGGNLLADGATIALADEVVGTADVGEVLFVVSGGTSPYNFSVVAGAVPDGMDLTSTVNADGSETVALEGTPTTASTPGTPASFSLAVSDSAGASLTVKKSITKK